ncbi:unnamed protein product [Medioppia subpectinata]|uniref:Uncharacterized protein n=1 Tax=Medioppia subpectinata TaxID=1979941 RepID=A0A7R9KPS3_9ACAR|nr:unnamed protein product [Medioppia subpectinata]CAG2107244.1 unnamed protein product [Medioppia subpectinata]
MFDKWYGLVAGVLVWVLVFLVVFYKVLEDCIYRRKAAQKINDDKKLLNKYLLSVVLSHSMDNFQMRGNEIKILLFDLNDKSVEFTIQLNNSEIRTDICGKQYIRLFLTLTTDICGKQYIRLFLTLTSDKNWPLIFTKLSAVHNSTGVIFMDGIEIEDEWTGRRLYFPIREYIKGRDELKDAKEISVKRQQLRLFSKQTLCPNFENPLIQETGEEVTDSGKRVNAVSIKPRLDLFEVSLFYALLFNLTFFANYLMVFLGVNSKPDSILQYITYFGGLAATGLLSFVITDTIAYVYVRYIKTYRKPKTKPPVNTDCFWAFVRVLYLMSVFVVAIISSIGTQLLFAFNNITSPIEDLMPGNYSGVYALIIIIGVFMIGLIIQFTIWISFLALIKYFFLLMFFGQNYTHMEDSSYMTDTTTEPKDVERREKQEVIKGSATVKTDKKPKTPVKLNAETKSKLVKFGVHRLDKELEDKERIERLSGKSLIHPITKSKGYIDPESLRDKP